MFRTALIFIAGILAVSCQSITPRTWDLPPTVKVLEANGYEMAYVERGSGIPVVLVHGSLTDYRYWAPQMESFSSNYRVVAVSLRHFYPESWNGEGNDFSVAQHAKDLGVFIRKLNAGPVHLVGHSRGGDVALLLARENPELLRSLTLADPAPLDGLLSETGEAVAEANVRRAYVSAAIDRLVQNDIDGGLEKFVDGTSGAGIWERMAEPMRQSLRQNAWTIKSLLTDAQTPYACSDAAAIKIPVLLVTGEKSPRPYGAMLDALAACLKQQRKAVIANASHVMSRMNPKAFNEAVMSFWR